MRPEDREEVLAMMRVFYDSPALLTNVPDEVLARDVDACLGDSPYVEGLILESLCGDGTETAGGQAAAVAGYSMLAKSFSTEFGGPCIWIEDLYLKPEYRSKGAGSILLAYVKDNYDAVITRLEVETENVNAVAAYRKAGYGVLGYTEMYHLDKEEKSRDH
ncbi:MAG: GNAT family N-acetyltransferase [Clostridiales bacterium]|nr:GNAT family N-acetyltransferase [Clostridiales bacterium]